MTCSSGELQAESLETWYLELPLSLYLNWGFLRAWASPHKRSENKQRQALSSREKGLDQSEQTFSLKGQGMYFRLGGPHSLQGNS